MNDQRASIFGTAITWFLAFWSWYEHHTAAVVGLFAILASCATIYAALIYPRVKERRRRRAIELDDDEPTTGT